MGLFSKKKKIKVSSNVYSLAGEEKDRPVYKRDYLLKYVLNGGNSYADVMVDGYLNGPGIKYRQFAKWAESSGFNNSINQRGTGLFEKVPLDYLVVASELPHDPVTEEVLLNTAEIDVFDFMYWAERHVAINHPNIGTADWTADIDLVTDEITITYSSGNIEKFIPSNFNSNSRYLYARYQIISNQESITTEEGTYQQTVGDDFPNTVGWTSLGSKQEVKSISLGSTITTTKSYSDGRPDEEEIFTETNETEYNEVSSSYSLETNPTVVNNIWTIKTLFRTNLATFVVEPKETVVSSENEINGVVVTTTVKTVVDTLKQIKKYKTDSSTTSFKDITSPKIFIYEENTGNEVLDEFFGTRRSAGEYLPFIPVAYNNRLIDSNWQVGYYNKNKKAFQKAFSDNYDDFIDGLRPEGNNNSNTIEGVDYGFVVFGVPLNTSDPTGKKYIYEFFNFLTNEIEHSTGSYVSWREDYNKAIKEWEDYSDKVKGSTPQSYLSKPRAIPSPPNLDVNVMGNLNYNMSIKVADIVSSFGSGMYDDNMSVGEVRISYAGSEDFYQYIQTLTGTSPLVSKSHAFTVATFNIIYQESATQWRRLRVFGAEHHNIIYRGKAVRTTAQDALKSKEDSKFIIPIQMDIFNNMSLIDSTQLTTCCSYIVLNSYDVYKTGGFFSSGFFKLVTFVVTIAITVYSGGTGAGLLGTNAAVGAAIGFSGIAAVVAGAVANAVAAMIVNKIISVAATAVFGEEIGAFVGMIASAYAIQAGIAMQSSGPMPGLSLNLGKMLDPKNLSKMAMSVASEYAKSVQADTQGILNETDSLMSEYQKQSAELEKLYNDNMGSALNIFNPLSLTDPFNFFGSSVESSDEFLGRTLLVGSDLANISNAYISEFANITLNTNLK